LRLQGARAIGFAPNHFSMAADKYYRARQFFSGNRISDHGIHARQTLDGNSLRRRHTGRKLRGTGLENRER
jgi:hypothetical protein